jgi:hypothetical protein
MKRIILIILLAFGLSVGAPQQAQAAGALTYVVCTPFIIIGHYMWCTQQVDEMIQNALEHKISRIAARMYTLIEMRFERALARNTILADQQRTINEGRYESMVANTSGANCPTEAAELASQAAGAGRGPGNAGGPPATPRPPRVVAEDPRSVPGGRPRVRSVEDTDTAPTAQTTDVLTQASVADAMRRRAGQTPETENGEGVAAVNQTRYRRTYYRNCGTEGAVVRSDAGVPQTEPVPNRANETRPVANSDCAYGLMPDADLTALTLLSRPTYISATAPVSGRTASADEWYNAAVDYCINAIDPSFQDRVRAQPGGVTADTVMAQMRERGGDARIGLALESCIRIAASRRGSAFDKDAPKNQWILSALCGYRRASGEGAAGNFSVGGIGASVDAGGDCQFTTNRVFISDYELMRILSSDIFGTIRFITNSQNTQSDLLRSLVSMESIGSQLNKRILDMQERIQLLQAAQLAVDVEQSGGR